MSELTAALATIEKLRAERDRLAAENVALKAAIGAVNRTAEECEVNGDELKYVVEPSEFEALTDLLGETPATDRIYAGIKADGVEGFVSNTVHKIFDESDAGSALAYLSLANAYVKQLRGGPNDSDYQCRA